MKFSSALLIFASVFLVGCAGSSPLSPDATARSLAATPASAAESFFPPIGPAGISCPSDAPQLRVSSIGSRMDIEFSEVKGALEYEIEIVDNFGVKVVMKVAAPTSRAEWYGAIGLYRVRVRTINCGGLGNWSAEVIHALDDDRPAPPPPVVPPPPPVEPPVEPPPPGPQCMVGCF
jgi:hypothetical protein